MAPYIESTGADGIYEVIEYMGAKTGARVRTQPERSSSRRSAYRGALGSSSCLKKT